MTVNGTNSRDTKKFWTTTEPYFFNKSKTVNIIILQENHKVTKVNKKILQTLTKDFTCLTNTLKLKKPSPALKKEPL